MSHGIRNRRRLLPLAAGSLALAALWSCDGQNLFAPDPTLSGGAAPVVEIQQPRQPAARPVGDSIYISARASDDTGVDYVLFGGIAYRGEVGLGTDTIVSRYFAKMVRFNASSRDTTVARYLLATPDSSRESAVLFAIAYDKQGNVSADTVALTIGGPRVEFLTVQDGQQVQSGLSLNLQVEAMDPEGILDLVIEVDGAFDASIEYTFNPPVDTIKVDTAVVIPDGITGPIQITATSRNGLGVSGQDGPLTLNIVDFELGDETPPSVRVSPSANAR